MTNTGMLAFMPVETTGHGALISLVHLTAMEQIAPKTSVIYLDDGKKFEVPYTIMELTKIADESFNDYIRNSIAATKAIMEEE